MNKKITNVVIAGGGTAGWMAAAAFAKLLGKNINVTLVESDLIPTVGVGEATIPTLHIFHDLLKINEAEFMAATNATFKLGISFENWRDVNQDYMHSFGYIGQSCWAAGFQHFWLKGVNQGVASDIGDYCPEHVASRVGKFAVLANHDRNHAFHTDAGLYARFLRQFSEKYGAKRIEGTISKVNLNEQNGFIESLTLADGQQIAGDLFIDCTGFKGMLIEETLHTGYDDWRHWLPCDSAIAVQTKQTKPLVPYTRSIAHPCGWQWQIPLQNRMGNGLVFCSQYLSDDDAKSLLLENIEGELINEPRVIKFRTGTRRKHWNKNCVAIGLSSGFIEPLESTSIHLIQQSIVRLMQNLPTTAMESGVVDNFNQKMRIEIENIRDFIVLHYHVTERKDSEFWRYCKQMDIPESLQKRIDLFKQSGQVYKTDQELFGEASWLQVMLGQGLMPEQYHPIVDNMSDDELAQFLGTIKQSIARRVNSLPNHVDFINNYCKSTIS
ncbi:tryptophan 7-halogenase [Shewanella sp. 5_MG-2023]|uniref:tryptophan halogenase family protein n=1 Tax=Shewanella sp. 5_MG-2023 TaxID=3062656 RepID=UPI0026E36ADD|nr:tryptophan halogenase family protein [Shewanella sp. 5_MG-2023]MDO6640735.1 tryptophan 7-halogenase [Shewanella sp. 5_MG-2023]